MVRIGSTSHDRDFLLLVVALIRLATKIRLPSTMFSLIDVFNFHVQDKMDSDEKKYLQVVPAESDDDASITSSALPAGEEDDLNGRADTTATKLAERRRFMALRTTSSKTSKDDDVT